MKTLNSILLIAITIISFSSCEKNNNCIYGSGTYVSRNYTTAAVAILSVYGFADVYLTQDEQTSLRIEGQENVLNALKVENKNGELSIGRDNCFKESEKLKVYLSAPMLSEISIAGICDVYTSGTFKGSSIRVDISGTGTMQLSIDVQEFTANISGDGAINLAGKADKQSIQISGIGEIEAFELSGKNGDVSIEGSGNVEINTSETLNIKISGIGDIYYLGNPNITQNISGKGSVVHAN